jgi:hypothetical protein
MGILHIVCRRTTSDDGHPVLYLAVGNLSYIKTNEELDKLIRHKNIRNHIKAQMLSWFGHLHRMPEERMVKKSM